MERDDDWEADGKMEDGRWKDENGGGVECQCEEM